MRLSLRALLVTGALFVVTAVLVAAPIKKFPVTLTQPDGKVIHCFASGDEYYNWLHDGEGFTILQDPRTGFYVYALKAKDRLTASPYVVGQVDPKRVGLVRGVNISPAAMLQKRTQFYNATPAHAALAPKTGAMSNIVVFIRFKGEPELGDQISTYDGMFNGASGNSLQNYFREASYGALTVNSFFYPAPSGNAVVSFEDAQPREYYQPWSATNAIGYTGGDIGPDRVHREHTLLMNATNAVASQVPEGLNIDADNNGDVDNICFIVSGSPTAWSSLLWPHRWVLYSQDVSLNGKRVWDYNLQLQDYLLPDNVGVLCHEMFHTLGAPDLYHYYSSDLSAVSVWDVMGADLNPPQHMGAYMKYRYGGWIASLPTITTTGRYTLSPLTSSTGNCYKIASPASATEFYVLEYRKRSGVFESSLPGDGLVIYRINGALDGQGNVMGPPDEVYVYRPAGTLTFDGAPYSANFSRDAGRIAFNDRTDPSGFLCDGTPGGLQIANISRAGDQISFTVGNLPVPDISWSLIGLTSVNVRSLAITSGDALLAGTSGGGLYRSTDEGADWSQVGAGTEDVSALGVSPGGRILAGTNTGVFLSTDDGAHWGALNTGLVDHHVSALVVNGGTGTAIAATPSGLFSTSESGGSWQLMGLAGITGTCLAFDSAGNIFAGSSGAGIYRSTDGGAHWAQSNTGLASMSVRSLVVDPDGDLYAGLADGVSRSTDNGVTWSTGGLGGLSVLGLMVNSIGHLYAGTSGNGLFRSTDSGAHWSQANNGMTTADVSTFSVNESEEIYVGSAGGGVFCSGDTPLPIQLLDFQAAALTDAVVGVAWTTLSETNNYGFEVQRSSGPSVGFHSLAQGFVPGFGTTIGKHDYRFVDSAAHRAEPYYRLRQIDLDGTVTYTASIFVSGLMNAQEPSPPVEFALEQNYPNPFNPATTIEYRTSTAGIATLTVFDILGREVASLVNRVLPAGIHRARLDGSALPSGVYFVRLEAGGKSGTRKIMLVK